MTAAISVPPNIYYRLDPAQVAQEKYCNATWNKAYAYYTLIALAALAIAANIYLSPLLPLAAVIALNATIAVYSYTQAWPKISEWFTKADTLNAQGDKEIQINAKLQEISALDTAALRRMAFFEGVHLAPDIVLQQRPTLTVIARALYYQERSFNLNTASVQLRNAHRYRESFETKMRACRASAKCMFFAMLIEHPDFQGKFKDSLTWVERSLEERAMEIACRDIPIGGAAVWQTRAPVPQDGPAVTGGHALGAQHLYEALTRPHPPAI